MKNFIASVMLAIGLTSCAVAPAYTQGTTCIGPTTLSEMVNAEVVLQGLPPVATLLDIRTLGGENAAIYYDSSVDRVVVVAFDFNWCATGAPIFLTREQANEMLNITIEVTE